MVIILNHNKPSMESVNNEFGSFRHDRLPSSFEQRQGWSYDANLSARKKPLKKSKFYTANSLVLIGGDPSVFFWPS
jgi:hypothetical protein